MTNLSSTSQKMPTCGSAAVPGKLTPPNPHFAFRLLSSIQDACLLEEGPDPRPIQPPAIGPVVAVRQVDVLSAGTEGVATVAHDSVSRLVTPEKQGYLRLLPQKVTIVTRDPAVARLFLIKRQFVS